MSLHTIHKYTFASSMTLITAFATDPPRADVKICIHEYKTRGGEHAQWDLYLRGYGGRYGKWFENLWAAGAKRSRREKEKGRLFLIGRCEVRRGNVDKNMCFGLRNKHVERRCSVKGKATMSSFDLVWFRKEVYLWIVCRDIFSSRRIG